MAVTISTLSVGVIAILVLYALVKSITSEYKHARKAAALGCKPPVAFWNNGFLGYKNLVDPLKAIQNNILPDSIWENWKEQSRRSGRQVGTFSWHMLGTGGLHTIDPENIKAILGKQFKEFELGEIRNKSMEPLLGDGIFSTDGEKWAHSRALLRPQFARDQVSDLDLEEQHFQNLLTVLPITSGWTSIIDIQPLFLNLTIDSATEFLFGSSCDSQLSSHPSYTRPKSAALHSTSFAANFDEALWELGSISLWGDFYWLAPSAKFRAAAAKCHAFIDHYVHAALSTTSLDDDPSKDSKYVFLHALARESRDPLFLRHQLMSILLAGRDTTASLLSWVLYSLIQHPEVFRQLRSTLIESFGTYEQPRNVTFAGLKNCTYLQYVLNETLRLYPIVPFNSRRANTDTSIPVGGGPEGKDPVYVRAGQEVVYTVHAVHRRKDLWGEDAEEFRPERWEGRKSGWEYLPFNGGARICIGQQFALTESGFVLLRLLQRFDVLEGHNVPPKGSPVKHGMSLTTRPAEGVKLRMRVANE